MRTLPEDPFARVPNAPFEPAARRTTMLFGAEVELCWLPERRGRRGRPGPDRPPFPPCHAPRIVADEAVWSDDTLALTPNLHPFGSPQLLLWSTVPRREPDLRFLEAGLELAAAVGGTLLVNSIGAAASIPWAHAHLIGERRPFLPALPLEPASVALLADLDAVAVSRARAPFPACLLALRGPAPARARAAERLIRLRTCAAFGLADQDGTTWVFPRRREVPDPHFPQALGSAELWGRWCYDDRDAFDAATPADLTAALGAAGVAHPPA